MSLKNPRLWLKVGKTVAIPRSCDRCGHRYFVNARVLIDVEFESILSDLSRHEKKVLRNALVQDTVAELNDPRLVRRFDEEARRVKDSETWRRNVGVLCPRCGQFSRRAMADHFPHGYADGLATKYGPAGSLASFLLAVGLLLWLPPVSILAAILRAGGPVTPFFWFLITAWTILLPLFAVIAHRGIRLEYSSIRAIGAKLSEEELHAFVVREYRRSYLSLKITPSWKRLQQFARSPTTSFTLPPPDVVIRSPGSGSLPNGYFDTGARGGNPFLSRDLETGTRGANPFLSRDLETGTRGENPLLSRDLDTGARDTELWRKLANLGVKRLVCFVLEFLFGWAGCGLLLAVAIWPEAMAEETARVRVWVGAALMTLAGFSYAAFLGRFFSGWLMWVLTPLSLLLLRDRHRREARELEGQLTVEGRRAVAAPANWRFRVHSGLLAGSMWLCFSVTSLALLFVTLREPAEYLLRELASGKNGMESVEALFSAWEREEDNVRDIVKALFSPSEHEENRGANESPEVGGEERDDGRDVQSPSESAVATVPDHDEASISDTFRLWTDATGEHTTEAVFVQHEGGTITLRKRDGRVIELPVERLSDGDQEWVRKVEADDGQEIEPGSVVVVLGESVEVKLEHEIIGHLTKGAKVTAVQVRDDWVGVNVETEDETMEGWVPREEVERWRH